MNLPVPELLASASTGTLRVYWLALGLLAALPSTLLAVLLLRRIAQVRASDRERVAMRWRRILLDHAEGLPVSVPDLLPHQMPGFVDAWNSAHRSLNDQGNPALQRVAREVGLEAALYRALERGPGEARLQAVVALGCLRGRHHFERLAARLEDGSTRVSLAAARALMQLDAGRALELIVPRIATRRDWPLPDVARLMHDTDPARAAQALADATLKATAHVAPRLLRCLVRVDPAQGARVARDLIDRQPDDRLMAACLRALAAPEDRDHTRAALRHPHWRVRMQAAIALGRVGDTEDHELLEPLMADEQWWVRYHAAQALVRLPDMEPERLAQVRLSLTERAALDVFDRVIAERHLELDA